jgi:hypothetical protein
VEFKVKTPWIPFFISGRSSFLKLCLPAQARENLRLWQICLCFFRIFTQADFAEEQNCEPDPHDDQKNDDRQAHQSIVGGE